MMKDNFLEISFISNHEKIISDTRGYWEVLDD